MQFYWAETVMFINKMETNTFEFWSDRLGGGGEGGLLTIKVGMEAGHLPTKIARRTGYFTIFSNARVSPGGMLAVGIDSHINSISCRYLFEQVTFSCKSEYNNQMQYVGGARG